MKNPMQSVLLTFLCSVLFVAVYSGVVMGIGKVIAPNAGDGEVLTSKGRVVGFKNVGQTFTQDRYFWSRPSAVSYNASGSAGSNKGPANPDYLALVQARIDSFMVHNPGVVKSSIPAEMVTASGSGLDPHISIESAMLQVPRVSKRRAIPVTQLQALVNSHLETRFLGIFGPRQINVLSLNIALDGMSK